MTTSHTMASLFRENKTLFILIAVGVFLIELEIFAVAAINSGRKSWLEIKDQRGNVIHVAILGIMLWVIYLRYLLAKKTIDSQTEVEKFRLQLAAGDSELLRLEYSDSALPPMIPEVASAPSEISGGAVEKIGKPLSA